MISYYKNKLFVRLLQFEIPSTYLGNKMALCSFAL